jgi:hypothetical protein
MKIYPENLTLAELKAVMRAIDIIKERGAAMVLNEQQVQSIANRIQELSMCEDCELTKYIKKIKENK